MQGLQFQTMPVMLLSSIAQTGFFKRDATRLMKMAYKYFRLNQLAEDFNLLTDPDETDIDLLLERVMGNKSAI